MINKTDRLNLIRQSGSNAIIRTKSSDQLIRRGGVRVLELCNRYSVPVTWAALTPPIF